MVYGCEEVSNNADQIKGAKMVNNCYQCAHYETCFLRIGVDNLLDEGHHKEVCGGKSVLKNSIARPFLALLAEICKRKSRQEDEA